MFLCFTPPTGRPELVADQWFLLKQWFAGGAQSRLLRKPGCSPLLFKVFPSNMAAVTSCENTL